MALDTTKKIKKVIYEGKEFPIFKDENVVDIGNGEYICKVIDYDGTVLKEKHLNTGEIFDLPKPPEHERLIFREWSTAVEIINNKVTVADSDIIIGAVYSTKSGLSEFDIELTKVTGLTIFLNLNGTKDWGDGTSDTEYTHTYLGYGKYMITCDGSALGNNPDFVWQTQNWLINARLGDNIRADIIYPFYKCANLETVSIPPHIITLSQDTFLECRNLKSIIFPNNTIRGLGFDGCYCLKNICMPNIQSANTGNEFYGCRLLDNIILSQKNNITTATVQMFYTCSSLKKIIFKQNITAISASAFASSYALKKIDFSNNTVVPTLANTNAFKNITDLTKIIVPDNLYDEWITATNWSTYVNYIYKASEVL